MPHFAADPDGRLLTPRTRHFPTAKSPTTVANANAGVSRPKTVPMPHFPAATSPATVASAARPKTTLLTHFPTHTLRVEQEGVSPPLTRVCPPHFPNLPRPSTAIAVDCATTPSAKRPPLLNARPTAKISPLPAAVNDTPSSGNVPRLPARTYLIQYDFTYTNDERHNVRPTSLFNRKREGAQSASEIRHPDLSIQNENLSMHATEAVVPPRNVCAINRARLQRTRDTVPIDTLTSPTQTIYLVVCTTSRPFRILTHRQCDGHLNLPHVTRSSDAHWLEGKQVLQELSAMVFADPDETRDTAISFARKACDAQGALCTTSVFLVHATTIIEPPAGEWVWLDPDDVSRRCRLQGVASELALSAAIHSVTQTTYRPASRPSDRGVVAPHRLSRKQNRQRRTRAPRPGNRRDARRCNAVLGCGAQPRPAAPPNTGRLPPVLPRPDVAPTSQPTTSERLVNAIAREFTDRAVRDSSGCITMDAALLAKLGDAARLRARTRGALQVTPRDVAEAANQLYRPTKSSKSPACDIPEHYDEMLDQLARIRNLVRCARRGAGGKPLRLPTVLVCGETHGIVASMFRLAGADVATCDLKGTDTPDIPHFQGDGAYVLDLGWDLVIGHPPCEYLSNAGLTWLYQEEDRYSRVVESAFLFRRMRAANAPFVAIENVKMHPYAQDLVRAKPTQYTHPWQHGTAETKAGAWYLSADLPKIIPSCVVQGRKHSMANLAPSPDRGDLRSRSFLGLSGAMAAQWTELIAKHASLDTNPRRLTAREMIEVVSSHSLVKSVKVCFYRRTPEGEVLIWGWERRKGRHSDLPGGHVDSDDLTLADALSRECGEEIALSPSWEKALKDGLSQHPLGHAAHTERLFRRSELHDCHVWAIEAPDDRPPDLRGDGIRESHPGTAKWRPAQQHLAGMDLDLYARAVREALSFAGAALVPPCTVGAVVTPSQDFLPWMYPKAKRDVPPTLPKQIQFRQKRWRAWQFSHALQHHVWTALPDELDDRLQVTLRTREDRPPRATNALKPVPEISVPDQCVYSLSRAGSSPPDEWIARSSSRSPPLVCALPYRPSVVLPCEPDSSVTEDSLRGFDEEDIALPPQAQQVSATCLYVRNFTVARRGRRRDQRQCVVDHALVCRRTIADTGAGPSVTTTGTLRTLPADARASRDYTPVEFPVLGPDGEDLITQGRVTIIFDLNGTPLTHTFLVVEGEPLIILGNDFLNTYKAVITMGDDAEEGRIEFITKEGGELRSRAAPVSSGPRSAARAVYNITAMPVLPDRPASDLTASTPPPTDADTGKVLQREVKPLPSCPVPLDPATKLPSAQLKRLRSSYLLYASSPVVMPQRSVVIIHLKAPVELRGSQAALCVDRIPFREGLTSSLGERTSQESPVHEYPPVAPAPVHLTEEHTVEVKLVNLEYRTISYATHSAIALLDVDVTTHDANPQTGTAPADGDYVATLSDEHRLLLETIPLDPDQVLSAEETEKARQMIARRIKAFATDPKDPKHTHLMHVELPLKDGAVPHRHAPAKLGEKGRQIVEEHCAEMEARGIIRKSNSAWGSRVVLVTKKDGSIRFCIDYRETNSKLRYLDSPIPLTNEAIDRLSAGKGNADSLFLSTLDLAAGFWCLPIAERDKHVTAFVTHRQKYEFNYLPFGIQSGPSYMCRLMDAALQGLAWEVCMPYLDDVGVWSTGEGDTVEARRKASFDQMLQRLDLVLERMEWAGLTCKATKCRLFATSAAYLGHVVTRDGLKMDPAKIETVSAIDPTAINDVTRVRSFLGLCSYYRRFVRHFAQIAGPLHELTKKGVDVAVQSQQAASQDAIKALIKAITSEPVLATPRFDRPFYVKTDGATTEGIGGVLAQKDDEGRERVIAYYGRRLKDAEKNWTVTEIELLAAKNAIKQWRPYLWGREFVLIVDHAALKWLHTMKDTVEGGPASRLMRWILMLNEYRFTVEHKPGKTHCDADGISRLAGLGSESSSSPAAPDLDPVQIGGPDTPALVAHLVLAIAVGKQRAASSDRATRSATRRAVPTARRRVKEERKARTRTQTRGDVVLSYLGSGELRDERMKEAQSDDPECAALIRTLTLDDYGVITGRESLRHAKWLLGESKHLEYIGGLLYKRNPDRESTLGGASLTVSGDLRLYVPSTMRAAILHSFHDCLGHVGGTKLRRLISRRYYWPGIHQDCEEHVAECHECTLAKPPNRRPASGTTVSVGAFPWDLLFCDLLSVCPTRDFVAGVSGYDKAVVFVDALTRWIEVIPVNGIPDSDQILDIFMTHIVARYGCPRMVRSDAGSNLASVLTDRILEETGIDLSPSTAEHHESVGIVERFNQTLVRMGRSSDEGGEFWVDHLPFILMAIRASHHSVTDLSPAALLYGRELRLPAQLGYDEPADHRPLEGLSEFSNEAILSYAKRLNSRLTYAWQAALHATETQQSESRADSERTTSSHRTYCVKDAVCRRLPDQPNKMLFRWAGPYRVRKVLGNDRYELEGLENQLIKNEFNSFNLRPYRTHVDAEELQMDEFVIDELLKKRTVRGQVQYRAKWRGHSLSKATWVAKSELLRRCSSLIDAYELAHPPTLTATPPSPARDPAATRDRARTSAVPEPPAGPTTDAPVDARMQKGQWTYALESSTPRGTRLRWLEARRFSPEELQSASFAALRRAAINRATSRDVAAATLVAAIPMIY